MINSLEKLEIVIRAAPPPFRIFAGGPPRPDLASGRKRFGLIQVFCTRKEIASQSSPRPSENSIFCVVLPILWLNHLGKMAEMLVFRQSVG